MVTYKYHFEDYIEDTSRTISSESRKAEIEIIMSYLIVFIAYLFMIIAYFWVRNKKNKGNFNLIVITISILFFVFCTYNLFNYVTEYKYCIASNMKHSDLLYSYKSLKNENEIIMVYLKMFIVYLLTITSYFSYRLLIGREK
jgi:amino acid transporter